jgi:dTDP-4-dehydrorhamnose reductase
VICAAITDVEKCFQNRSLSEQVNVLGTKHLLEAIKKSGAIPVFFSSDYVFHGNLPNKESDKRNPTTIYGRQKAEVEKYIESNFAEFLLFRTSKLVAKFNHPKNILSQIAHSLSSSQKVSCFEDQRVNPIFIEDIAELLKRAFQKSLNGVYHLGTDKIFTRVELGIQIAKSLNFEANLIQPTRMSDMKFQEIRPTHNLLSCEKIKSALNFCATELEEGLSEQLLSP